MPTEATGKTGKPTPSRNKPERPRDQLGRPQPWGAPNTLELEDYDALPLERNHALARGHFNAGRFFPAHEAWETAWKQARDTSDAEELSRIMYAPRLASSCTLTRVSAVQME